VTALSTKQCVTLLTGTPLVHWTFPPSTAGISHPGIVAQVEGGLRVRHEAGSEPHAGVPAGLRVDRGALCGGEKTT